MKAPLYFKRASGFTLAEMMIVITIIALLAGLTLQGYTYAMRGSKRRVTETTIVAIQSSLDRYFDKFGEFPEPASADGTVEITVGKLYNASGAKCLYQALRGDGFDAIKGASQGANSKTAASDGNFQTDEAANVTFKDMPPAMWRNVNGNYIIVDGFSHPFQYIKAAPAAAAGAPANSDAPVTINTTYDFWSYADDEVNIARKSKDVKENPTISAKWIKNWN